MVKLTNNEKIFLIFLIFFLSLCLIFILSNKCTKENFVEYLDTTTPAPSPGRLMLTDPNGNLSTYDLGSNNTLVSNSNGNVSAIRTGQFNDFPITTNSSITARGTLNAGNTTINGTLNAGSTTLGTLNAGNTTLGTLNTGNTTINGTLNTGNTSINGTLNAGNTTLGSSTLGNTTVNGNLTTSGLIRGDYDFDAFSDMNATTFSSAWIIDNNNNAWDPRIRGGTRVGLAYTTADRSTADATASIATVPVPIGMRTGYLHHLPWTNCGYFDVFGVLASGAEVFIKRVNNLGRNDGQTEGYHNGISIVAIPSVDRFSSIRIKGVRGRIHYMGMGWDRQKVPSENGFIHSENVIGGVQLGDISWVHSQGGKGYPVDNDSTNFPSAIVNAMAPNSDQALMIVGNKSSGIRTVKLWDQLIVNGNNTVNGNNIVNGNNTVNGKLCIGKWCFQDTGDELILSRNDIKGGSTDSRFRFRQAFTGNDNENVMDIIITGRNSSGGGTDFWVNRPSWNGNTQVFNRTR